MYYEDSLVPISKYVYHTSYVICIAPAQTRSSDDSRKQSHQKLFGTDISITTPLIQCSIYRDPMVELMTRLSLSYTSVLPTHISFVYIMFNKVFIINKLFSWDIIPDEHLPNGKHLDELGGSSSVETVNNEWFVQQILVHVHSLIKRPEVMKHLQFEEEPFKFITNNCIIWIIAEFNTVQMFIY